MIGLPDCSVTYDMRVWWLEFKYFEMKRKWENYTNEQLLVELINIIKKDSPAQWDMVHRLDTAATAYYIIWVKKTCVLFYHPRLRGYLVCRSTPDAVQTLVGLIHGNLAFALLPPRL